MPKFSFVLLYVENPHASASFYADLLDRPFVDNLSTFAMLPLSEGVMLGLWSRKSVEPARSAEASAGEVASPSMMPQPSQRRSPTEERGLTILQEPVRIDLGQTFVAADPDGHRLRVFVPGAA